MANTVRAEYYNDFFSQMSLFRSSGRFCDVKIRVGDEVFNCHRNILSLASEYFNRMFGGNFCESSSQEVVLEQIDARVFEVTLNFIYTGEAKISSTNVYDVIRAGDFYQLPRLIEYCGAYILENLNAPAENILKILLYAQNVGIKQIVKLLRRHIYEHFDYFSNAPEFVELSIDTLLDILGAGAENDILWPQDALFEGIYTWITHQENLNSDEKKSYFDRLCERIDLSLLSDQYTKDRFPECMAVLSSLEESIDFSISTPDVVRSCPKLLRAYVQIIHEYDCSSMGTMIFSGFFGSDPDSWMYSGKVVDCFSDYMKTVVIGDRLYSLGYSRGQYGEDPVQTFRCSNYFSMYPYTSLSLPPFVTDLCDMCAGTANEIYLYKKYGHSFDSKPDQHLYFYKRDIDRWFPLPSPKFNVSYASMVYDGERLYLVGGSTTSNLIQAYDARTRAWTMLPPTMKNYCPPECCIYGKEICIMDGYASSAEIYDPSSGKSRALTRIHDDLPFRPHLENCADFVLEKDSPYYDETIIRHYMTADQLGWIPLPKLNDAVARVDSIPQDVVPYMLDVFTF